MLWRPVLAKMATYREVCHDWSLKDLLDAHDILNLQAAEERRQIAESKAR